MRYTIQYRPAAQRSLRKLPAPLQDKAIELIGQLAVEPRPHGCVKIAGSRDEWRIKIDPRNRIRYRVDDREGIVLIEKIGAREGFYG